MRRGGNRKRIKLSLLLAQQFFTEITKQIFIRNFAAPLFSFKANINSFYENCEYVLLYGIGGRDYNINLFGIEGRA